jgi:hypothetical protein
LLLLAEVSALPLHTEVATIGNNAAEAEMIQQVLIDAGVTHVNYRTTTAKEVGQKPNSIASAAVAIVAPEIPDSALSGVSNSVKLVPFNINIEQANLLLIKARLGTIKSAKNLG